MEAGKTYYIMIHAYHHVIARVAEVLGPTRVRLTGVVWVYRCGRGWTEFFRDGFGSDTTYHHFPDGEITNYLAAWDWKLPYPGDGNAK